jgi:hypothetical protein
MISVRSAGRKVTSSCVTPAQNHSTRNASPNFGAPVYPKATGTCNVCGRAKIQKSMMRLHHADDCCARGEGERTKPIHGVPTPYEMISQCNGSFLQNYNIQISFRSCPLCKHDAVEPTTISTALARYSTHTTAEGLSLAHLMLYIELVCPVHQTMEAMRAVVALRRMEDGQGTGGDASSSALSSSGIASAASRPLQMWSLLEVISDIVGPTLLRRVLQLLQRNTAIAAAFSIGDGQTGRCASCRCWRVCRVACLHCAHPHYLHNGYGAGPTGILYCTHTLPTALILYSYSPYCTHTVLILSLLHSYCTHTVLTLYSYCTHTVLILYS